uniref:Uncharacterized protein n=1 Tax=Oryza glaberrima TaxID=4538 RepID=I1QTC1_ORYGL
PYRLAAARRRGHKASSTLLLPGRCYTAFTVRLSRRWWCRCRQPPWPDVDRDRSQIIVAPVDEDAAASFNELLVFFYAKDGFSSHTNILASGVAVQQCHIFLQRWRQCYIIACDGWFGVVDGVDQ